ncbi:MAG: hypothetical protein M1832_005246 [Thelocarpon impressellum]|nr:MAG: hypothetical protein M1832_005246 [Thelocarpon impressellum]
MRFSLAVIALSASAGGAVAYDGSSGALPIVDLGYTVQQASGYNDAGQYYNFSNIRYGEPPVGNLRFAPPVAAKENRTLQLGDVDRMCYQASPLWTLTAQRFLPLFLAGNAAAFYNTSTSASRNTSIPQIPQPQPRETEDCLFLDVVVPKKIYESRGQGSGAAVLVWIFGGGYTSGSKNSAGNPAGLLDRSDDGGGQGVIYVAMNYRLGAFGWLGGPTLQSNGTANVGLLDQRLALEWIRQNIHLFGGDPERVTVFGESAGGGSIMHHITSYGGLKGPLPFQRAVPQSAAFNPLPDSLLPEKTANQFLQLLNVSNIHQARKMPSMALRTANSLIVGLSSYGSFTFGPVVDGSYVPALPGKLLLQGSYDKSLTLMIGHNAQEGLLFYNPDGTNETGLEDFIKGGFPLIQDSILSYITDVLYPPVSDGSSALPYTNEIERGAFITSEGLFTCNTNYLARAFDNKTYNYLFSAPPALHGQDVAYTYFTNSSAPASGALSLPVNETVALALQRYITEFAESGVPNGPGVPQFNMYGDDARILDLGAKGINEIVDPNANERCLWWQKALYF